MRQETREQIKAGIADSWPVALGMVPLGVAFGLLITQVGFSWWWAPIFSFVIYAGSMEFLAITLVTGGVGPVSAALYGLLVNFRHVFYALNYPLSTIRSLPGKAYGVYSLTDETYAVISSHPNNNWTGTRIITIQMLLQGGWVGGGLLGALGGEALPLTVEGMEFALTALFTVLLIEACETYRDLSLPISAMILGILAWLISPDNMLMIGMSAYFLLLIIRHVSPRVDQILRWKIPGKSNKDIQPDISPDPRPLSRTRTSSQVSVTKARGENR